MKRLPNIQGHRVYPLWRLDENISWHNVHTYFMGIIYGFVTLEWLRGKHYHKRLWPVWNFWIPPVWSRK